MRRAPSSLRGKEMRQGDGTSFSRSTCEQAPDRRLRVGATSVALPSLTTGMPLIGVRGRLKPPLHQPLQKPPAGTSRKRLCNTATDHRHPTPPPRPTPYIENERHFALNLAKNKDWYLAEMKHFKQWAEKVGVPWRIIEKQLHDIMDNARSLWPALLLDLPMISAHKEKLREHWKKLHPDFQILTGD